MVHERRRAFRFRVPEDQQRVEVALESKPHETVPAVLLDESATGFGVLIPRLPVRAENYLLLRLPAGWVRTRVIHVEPRGEQLRVGLQLVEELFSPEEESPLEESVPLVRGDRVQGLWSWWQGAAMVLALAGALGWLAWSVRTTGSLGISEAKAPAKSQPPGEPDTLPRFASPQEADTFPVLSPAEQQLAMQLGPALLLHEQVASVLELSPRQKEMLRLLAREAEEHPERFHRLSLFMRAWELLTPEQRRRWRRLVEAEPQR